MSELAVSERGSTKDSLAGSVYASSEIMDDEDISNLTITNSKQSKEKMVYSSAISDDNTELFSSVSLRLPFNLLKLEPLQKIKISTMVFPFPSKSSGMVKKESVNDLLSNLSFGSKNTSKKDSQSSNGFETDNSTVKNESVYDWISEH